MSTKKIPIIVQLVYILIMVSMINLAFTISKNNPGQLDYAQRYKAVFGMVNDSFLKTFSRHVNRRSDEQSHYGGSVQAEIAESFERIGYKPVPDLMPSNEVSEYKTAGHGVLKTTPCENIQYKEWCEETFDNGSHIYEAYKSIAFDLKYTPEESKSDFWQTPIETIGLKKGDCEDAVLLFFSKIPPLQKNARIVWGWVIVNQSSVGRAHVWYQLTDKKGREYVVEGFSNDWNGIIPMEIVEESEIRKSILTISHSMVSKLSRLFPKVDNWQMCQTLVDLFTPSNLNTYFSDSRVVGAYGNLPGRQTGIPLLHLSLSDHEFIEYPADNKNKSWRHIQFINYSPRREIKRYMNREVSNIMEKLHEVFTRSRDQNRKVG